MSETCPECGETITPFDYCACERARIPEPVHPVIGKCADCGEDAFTTEHLTNVKLCWPCAYNRANW